MPKDRTSHSVVSAPTSRAEYRGEKPLEISEQDQLAYPNLCLGLIGKRLRYLEARQSGIDDALMLLLGDEFVGNRAPYNLVQSELGTPSREEARRLEEQGRAIWSREVGRPASEAPDMKRFGDSP